jgi:hypothetical protein
MTLESYVALIYVRGSGEVPPQTLTLEIYFKDDSHPKVELEIYSRNHSGMDKPPSVPPIT